MYALLGREPWIRFDLTNLEDMPLLVRRDEQYPLIGVGTLSLHEMAAQIIVGGPDILKQARMLLAVCIQAGLQIAQPFRDFGWDGLLAMGSIDAVPEHVLIGGCRFAAGGCLERVLQ